MSGFPPPLSEGAPEPPPLDAPPSRLPPVSTPPPGPPPGPPERPRQRTYRWWFALPIAIAIYLFLALVTLVQPVSVASLSLTVPIPGVSTAQLFGLPDRPFTVMIVGLDIRPTQDGPSRTDSILLLRVDPDRNRGGIVSIPRDSMMQVPIDGTVTQDRVNTAFVYNWSPEDPNAAPRALARTIGENLGLAVDYYMVFDQRGAADLIDAAGGVTVNVQEAFGQDNYSDDDVHVVPQFFPEGRQHLDGYEAVAYGRIREGTSDFDRIRRQQQVAEGLVEQLSSPSEIFKLPGVWSAFRDAVDTNMSRRETAGLFLFLKRMGSERIVTRSLGDAAVSCDYCQASIVLLDPEATSRLISEAFDDEHAGREAAQLLVAAGVTP